MSCGDARPRWRARTLALRGGPNPPPNSGRTHPKRRRGFCLTVKSYGHMMNTQLSDWNCSWLAGGRFGGLSVAGKHQILGSSVTDLLPCWSIPVFLRRSICRCIDGCGRAGNGDAILQNKANLRMAQLSLTAGQEKGYRETYEIGVCENKANLDGVSSLKFQVSSKKGRMSTSNFTLQTPHFPLSTSRKVATWAKWVWCAANPRGQVQLSCHPERQRRMPTKRSRTPGGARLSWRLRSRQGTIQ